MTLNQLIFKILKWVKNLGELFFFLFSNLTNVGFTPTKLPHIHSEEIFVLGNGPSLTDATLKLSKDRINQSSFIASNFFVNDILFKKIKPNFYCLADPRFFREKSDQAILEFYNKINLEVNWPLVFLVPMKQIRIIKNRICNNHIQIAGINTTYYIGFNSLRNYFYKKGLATPMNATVANLAIYAAIFMKYKTINLLGMEHNWTNSLYVDENNILYSMPTHFYTKDNQMKPLLRAADEQPWDIASYLNETSYRFISHNYLSLFAKKFNCEITNYTQQSLIDCYNRNKLQ